MREADIRTAIITRVERAAETAMFVSEMAVCQAEARVDVAVVQPQRLVGWEIKTKTDTLARLAAQQEVYSRVFDRMWLAADAKHLDQAISMVPPWWGVMRAEEVSGVGRLVQIRASHVNREVDLRSVVSLLWRDEAIAELDDLRLSTGAARAPRRDLWDRLTAASPAHISPSALRRRVRFRLMARTDWRSDELRR